MLPKIVAEEEQQFVVKVSSGGKVYRLFTKKGRGKCSKTKRLNHLRKRQLSHQRKAYFEFWTLRHQKKQNVCGTWHEKVKVRVPLRSVQNPMRVEITGESCGLDVNFTLNTVD